MLYLILIFSVILVTISTFKEHAFLPTIDKSFVIAPRSIQSKKPERAEGSPYNNATYVIAILPT